MGNFAAGGLTSAGSTTLPLAALVGVAGTKTRVREIGVFNTTATAVTLKLCRLTTAGTPGAALSTPAGTDATNPETTTSAVRGTYTGTAPTTADLGYRCVLGAAIGSGFVWTFDDHDLAIAAANFGIGILVENGTGQPLQVYFKWSE